MYEVEIIAGFSAAHRLREYKGKCERLHGHNYKVHVRARAQNPGQGGMVMDFGDLKKATAAVVDRLDHAFLNDLDPFDTVEPSAENIAAHIFHKIAEELGESGGVLYSVSVWESDTAKATFIRDDL